MNLPIKFPSDAELIAEEAARFRALTPEQRIEEIREMCRLHEFLLKNSARPEEVVRLLHEEKESERKAIREFIARHTK
jgi:hypothetical protein